PFGCRAGDRTAAQRDWKSVEARVARSVLALQRHQQITTVPRGPARRTLVHGLCLARAASSIASAAFNEASCAGVPSFTASTTVWRGPACGPRVGEPTATDTKALESTAKQAKREQRADFMTSLQRNCFDGVSIQVMRDRAARGGVNQP